MSRTGHVKLSGNGGSDVRLTDRISLGVLADVVPRDFIEDVLNRTGRRERRSRLLPAHVMVRFCMAMCLFFDDDYEEVMRKLVGSLKDMRSWSDSWHVPSTSAITQARQRLGAEPLRELFEDIAVPVAGPGTKGAWLRSWRLMSIDGCTLNIPDTAANVAEFNRSNNGPNASAYPIVRVVGLGECGSHVLVDAALGGAPTGETTLAKKLTRSFEADMLITADRNFYSFPAWRETLEAGADALWRVKSNLLLPVARVLPDGSYLSAVFPPKLRNYHKKEILTRIQDGAMPHTTQAIVVRVVEYEIPDRERTEEHDTIRLITSILDPEDIPAIELAAAYSERWEYESLLDEVKTHQRGPGRVLRSQSPEMVRQEIWALLLTHYSIRALMCQAADEADIDPDRLSFMRTLRVIRRQVTNQAAFSPSKTEKGTRGDDD